MLVEGGDDLDPLRAMVELVEPAPQKIDLMPPAVPPIVNKADDQVAHQPTASDAKGVGRPAPVPDQPAVPADAGDVDRGDLETVEQRRPRPPAGHLRPRPAGPSHFAPEHYQPHAEHDQGDEHLPLLERPAREAHRRDKFLRGPVSQGTRARSGVTPRRCQRKPASPTQTPAAESGWNRRGSREMWACGSRLLRRGP